MDIRPLDIPPANLEEFRHEIAAGLLGLYGEAASQAYLKTATIAFANALADDRVRGLGVFDGQECRGMAWLRTHGSVVEVPFLHILEPYAHQEAVDLLVDGIVAAARKTEPQGIVFDTVPLGKPPLTDAFLRHSFQHFDRCLMRRILVEETPRAAQCGPLTTNHIDAAATLLIDAYSQLEERWLYPSVSSADAARAFLHAALEGAFALPAALAARVSPQAGPPQGICIGGVVAPGTGFILQLAVAPSHRRRGVAATLLRDVLWRFKDCGLVQAALAVTKGNPARRLYESLGFEEIYEMPAFCWWNR